MADSDPDPSRSMLTSGNRIFHTRDEWGAISVFQEGHRRYLCFNDEIEQSCIDMQAPGYLCHNYTRVMMLGFLLHQRPRRCLILGLGAGALINAILRYFPNCKVDAVEHRRLVAEIAKEWFALPPSPQLQLHLMDARHYLERSSQQVDIIMTDLYLDDGMNDLQAQHAFLANARRALTPGGVLVGNYWLNNPLTSYALNQSLLEVFDHQLVATGIPDGNCITFAFDRTIPQLSTKRFIAAAQQLGQQMDIPLQRHARTLMHENRLLFRHGAALHAAAP